MSFERINEAHNPYNLTGEELEQLRHKNKSNRQRKKQKF